MSNNIQSIIDRYNAGEKLDFIFFWGPGEAEQPRNCFNQWSRHCLLKDGFLYTSAEQAMMAEKALLFKDIGTLAKILVCPDPRNVKLLGRQVRGYDEKIWEANRVEIVTEISYQKFKLNAEARDFLLSTKGKILVEASPLDKIWGIKMAESNPSVLDPNKWLGLNCLGESLMNARDRLELEYA